MWVLLTQKIGNSETAQNWVNTDMVERVHSDLDGGSYVHFQSGYQFCFKEDPEWWQQNVVDKQT
jgi:hypothetical protein